MEAEEMQRSPWADMAPDLLAKIFGRLSLKHLLSIIPSVCTSWQLASLHPLCYLSLDLSSSTIRLLESILLPRAQGRLLHVYAPYVCNLSSMYLLAISAPMLRTLYIPNSYLDDKWAAYAAPLMPHIVDLNLNLCSDSLSHLAIEAFGKSCRHVLRLRQKRYWQGNFPVSDNEALAISQYYPFIKHLELQNNPLSEQGLKAILLHCPLLEYLDLAGCRHLWNMNSRLLDECHARIKVFYRPSMPSDDHPYANDDCRLGSKDVEDYDNDMEWFL